MDSSFYQCQVRVINVSVVSPHVIYGVEYVLTHMKKYVSTWKQKIECLYPWLVITSKYHFWFASNVKVWWFHFQWTILGFNRYSPLQDFCKKMPLQSILCCFSTFGKLKDTNYKSTRKWLAQKLLEVHLSCYEQNADD